MGKAYREKLGYMPQQQGFYEQFSAMEFLRYIGKLKGLKGKRLNAQIEELVSSVPSGPAPTLLYHLIANCTDTKHNRLVRVYFCFTAACIYRGIAGAWIYLQCGYCIISTETKKVPIDMGNGKSSIKSKLCIGASRQLTGYNLCTSYNSSP